MKPGDLVRVWAYTRMWSSPMIFRHHDARVVAIKHVNSMGIIVSTQEPRYGTAAGPGWAFCLFSDGCGWLVMNDLERLP